MIFPIDRGKCMADRWRAYGTQSAFLYFSTNIWPPIGAGVVTGGAILFFAKLSGSVRSLILVEKQEEEIRVP